jgi:hypothetical protein
MLPRVGQQPSTTLTAVAVGADQSGSFTRCLQAKPADLSENVGGRGWLILPNGSFDNGEEFALQRPVMPRRPLPQPLHDMVRHILNRKIYWHGSNSRHLIASSPHERRATCGIVGSERPNRRSRISLRSSGLLAQPNYEARRAPRSRILRAAGRNPLQKHGIRAMYIPIGYT